MKPLTNDLAIGSYLHCSLCCEERPSGVSQRDYARLGVGWTRQGLQVWCNRHEVNVMHVDFEGAQHPANTTRPTHPHHQLGE